MSASMEQQATPRHPIRVVAERTGLSPDVLRAWQRRYGVVRPGRSERGQRLYSDEEVERLRLLGLAVQGGRAVSQVASLPAEALARVVAEDAALRVARPARAAGDGGVLEKALAAVAAMDAEGLELALRRALVVQSVPRFLEDVAVPLFAEIGLRWERGDLTPAHEHMASAVMRRVLEWVIVACEARAGASRIVLATLPEEYHEIGALLAATTAAAAGWSVTYLGANLPVAGIAAAAEQVNAAAVGVSVVYALDARRVRAQVDELRALLPARIDLLVGGSAWLRLGRKRGVTGVHTVRDLADLRAYLGRPTGVDASRSRRAR